MLLKMPLGPTSLGQGRARLSGPVSRITILSLLLLALGGCRPVTSGGLFISCTVDEDCGPGLSCIPLLEATDAAGDAGCQSFGKVCGRPCTTSTDCAPLDAGLSCSLGCNATSTCQVPAP